MTDNLAETSSEAEMREAIRMEELQRQNQAFRAPMVASSARGIGQEAHALDRPEITESYERPPQLQLDNLRQQRPFLMWGWIRSVVASTVQMIVGAVVFVVVATLLLTPFEKYSNSVGALLGSGSELTSGEVWARGWSMFMEFLPLAVVAMLGAFKAGEITNMILSGGGVPSSGMSDRMQGARGAASGVRGAAGGVAALAGAGMAVASGGAALAARAGGQVLSAATRSAGRAAKSSGG